MTSQGADWAFIALCAAAGAGAVATRVAETTYLALPILPGVDEPPSRFASADGPSQLPVSIVIPARDEAGNLRALLPTIAGQGAAEVIVVDDDSSDETSSVATAFGARVVSPVALARGWTGKSQACALGAEVATREWLLFLDADTRLGPNVVGRAIELAERRDVGALSLFLHQELGTLWEKLLVPFGYCQFFAGLAVDPRSHLLNGQFILIRRRIYAQTGGHAAPAVRAAVAEDVELARLLRAKHVGVGIARTGDGASVRMYHGLAEVRRGFAKNTAAFLSNSPLRGLTVVAATAAETLPIPLVALAASRGGWQLILAMGVWLGQSIAAASWRRRFLGRESESALVFAALNPVAAIVFQAIGIESIVRQLVGKPTIWKGRRYGRRRR